MGIREVESIMNAIKAATRIDAHIHMGTAIDDAWQDTISVTIVASRYWKEENEAEDRGDEKSEADPAPTSDSTATALSPPPKKRRRRNSETQSQLILGGISKGLFKDVQPTIVGTEDMDVPTFIRKHVTVDK